MPKEEMEPIASSEGVKIYCPKNGRFSFFNSPYPAHRSCSAIDIYPKNIFGDVAPSPFGGEVTEIRRVKCPFGKGFEGTSHDCVTLFRSLENPERWIKVLHIEPLIKVGDVVELGEELGHLLRSGFFDFWTDPHVHVEVRNPSDSLRASGGFKFERLTDVRNIEPAVENLKGTVVESKPEYSLIALDGVSQHGLPVDVDGHTGLLDAGIPHYGWIGVHMDAPPTLGGTASLCGRKIGIIKSVQSNMGIAECCGLSFALEGKPVRLSLYLWLSSRPLVKVVPQRFGELALKRLEEVSLSIF